MNVITQTVPQVSPIGQVPVDHWIELALATLDAEAANPTSRRPFQAGPYRFAPAEVEYAQFADCWVVEFYGMEVVHVSRRAAIEAVRSGLPGFMKTMAQIDADQAPILETLRKVGAA